MNNIVKNPYVLVAFTLLVYASSFFLDWVKGKSSAEGLLTGAVYSLCVIAISIFVYAIFSKIGTEQEYTKQVDILKAFIKANGLGQIINENQLNGIERAADSIWVFTLDMSNDLGANCKNEHGNSIYETVRHNLIKGKKYTYFVPDTPAINGALEEYRDKHRYEKGQVTFCVIPYEEFHFISEILIYDAETGGLTQAFEWFPSDSLNYYFKLDDDHRRNIVGVAKRLLKKYTVKEYTAKH